MFSSYRSLLNIPRFRKMLFGLLFTRLGGWMWGTALILFVLDKYQSTELTGVAVLFSTVPGLIFSPIAGAIVDQYSFRNTIIIIQISTGILITLIPILTIIDLLPFWGLMLIVTLLSLIRPIGNIAYRSLLPTIVSNKQWDQANAIDGIIQEIAVIIGPAIAGTLFGVFDAAYAMFCIAICSALGFLGAISARDLPNKKQSTKIQILKDAKSGLLYLMKNPSLRGLSLAIPFYVMTFGVLQVGLPILVEERLNWEKAAAGGLWTIIGIASLVSNIVFGRYNTKGRERNNLALGMLISLAGFGLLAFSTNLIVIICGLLLIGSVQGLVDINLSSLRQRRTAPDWYGRVFSVLGMLVSIGNPIGSSLAGFTLDVSLTLTLSLPVISGFLAVLLLIILVPKEEEDIQPNIANPIKS